MTQTYDGYKRKRIVEVIDSKGESWYYPQFKFLLWWFDFYRAPHVKYRFYHFNDCKDFLLYERVAKKRIHYV